MMTLNDCVFSLTLHGSEQFIFNFNHHGCVDDPVPHCIIDATRTRVEISLAHCRCDLDQADCKTKSDVDVTWTIVY
jgi:hypothetical protein